MKITIIKLSVFSGALAAFVFAATAFAAHITLTNGGLGQTAANLNQFGVAVCNKGAQTVTVPIPVTVAVGSVTTNLLLTTPLVAGKCEYSYLSYSQFNMQSGQTYSVQVAIDPQRTIISNNNNLTTYTVTVPKLVSTPNPSKNSNLSADVGTQLTTPLKAAWNLLGKVYRHLR